MAGNGDDQRISLSLSTLRTEVRLANAELELSIRKFVGAELEKKASAGDVKELAQHVAVLTEQTLRKDAPLVLAMDAFEKAQNDFAQGNFTPAQRRSFLGLVDEWWKTRSADVWTFRRRALAVAGGIIAIGTLGVGIAGIVVGVQ